MSRGTSNFLIVPSYSNLCPPIMPFDAWRDICTSFWCSSFCPIAKVACTSPESGSASLFTLWTKKWHKAYPILFTFACDVYLIAVHKIDRPFAILSFMSFLFALIRLQPFKSVTKRDPKDKTDWWRWILVIGVDFCVWFDKDYFLVFCSCGPLCKIFGVRHFLFQFLKYIIMWAC